MTAPDKLKKCPHCNGEASRSVGKKADNAVLLHNLSIGTCEVVTDGLQMPMLYQVNQWLILVIPAPPR